MRKSFIFVISLRGGVQGKRREFTKAKGTINNLMYKDKEIGNSIYGSVVEEGVTSESLI